MIAKKSSAPILRTGQVSGVGEKLAEVNQQFRERDVKALAKQKGTQYVNLKSAPIDQDALRLTTWVQVEQSHTIPFRLRGKELSVACSETDSQVCRDAIENYKKMGYHVVLYTCSREGISSAKRFFDQFLNKTEVVLKTEVEEGAFSLQNVQNFFTDQKAVFLTGNGPEMVNMINLKAVASGASDVHFQPTANQIQVRMRVEGDLFDVLQLSPKQYQLLSGEIKRLAGLKLNLTQEPQDGEYDFIVNGRQISARVSTLPSEHGEGIVLRILDAKKALVNLESLGFSDVQKNLIKAALEKQRGLILVTGPTGSGKTSTLYSCLNLLNTSDKKIITLEDPIEYRLKGIIQSQIEEDEGYGFAKGLRAILRQDPNVIMVGEIRDKGTAETALQAALTGHLVLSTLHSNDAVSAIPRLLDMGVSPAILSSGLELIVSQRLLKGSGDLGKRILIAEALAVSDSLRGAILQGASSEALLEQAKSSGFMTMEEAGEEALASGKISDAEIKKLRT
ncbi:MAG: GspE/PulE family protein [bacterium]|nr:GspE/PulE family protein [bacterium]